MSNQQIQIKNLPAPCITPVDIEALIACETYFTAGDGFAGAMSMNPEFISQAEGDRIIQPPEQLDLLTVCVLITRNGHTVTGESYCADPAKFDEATGRTEARKRAIEKLWPMVIYAERERLARETQPADHRDRVRAEAAELDYKLDKLTAFLATDIFVALPATDRDLLTAQRAAMLDYSCCLHERIQAFESAA